MCMRIINEYGPISKIEISRLSGLNPATVTNVVNELINEKFVVISGEDRSSGGRKPTLLSLNDGHYYSIGVSLKEDEINIAAINLKGEKIAKILIPVKDILYLFDLINIIDVNVRRIMKLCERSYEELISIGFITDGIIDREKGLLISSPYYKWNRLNLRHIFEKNFNREIYFDSRSRAIVLAEKIYGNGKKSSNIVAVDIGDYISVGIIVGDNILDGNNNGSGELSHVRVSNKNRCVCGKIGCLNTFVSERSIKNRFVEKISLGEISSLTDKYDIEEISVEMICKASEHDDKVCESIVKDTGKYIGRGISYIVNLINPEMIFISGNYLGNSILNREINRGIVDYSINRNLNQVFIGESTFKDEADIIGACTLGLKNIFLYDGN